MSDFPQGGVVKTRRAWLDNKGFEGLFIGWEADAILGLEREDIRDNGGRDWLRLWGFLNTARQPCNFIISLFQISLLTTFKTFCIVHQQPTAAFKHQVNIMTL